MCNGYESGPGCYGMHRQEGLSSRPDESAGYDVRKFALSRNAGSNVSYDAG